MESSKGFFWWLIWINANQDFIFHVIFPEYDALKHVTEVHTLKFEASHILGPEKTGFKNKNPPFVATSLEGGWLFFDDFFAPPAGGKGWLKNHPFNNS